MPAIGNSSENGASPVRKRTKKARNAAIAMSVRPRRTSAIEGPGQLRQQREQVADEAVVGDTEDRRRRIGVDGDDDFAFLHAGEMLDGARDAAGDVEIGGDDLASLADLQI